jgi:adenosylcobinamide-phosphate synthase
MTARAGPHDRRDPPPPRWPLAAGLIAGAITDALAGDPARGHPVALFGQAVSALERRVYAARRSRGTAFTAGSVLLATAPVMAAAQLTRRSPLARLALTAALTWAVTGARSLAAEAARIHRALAAADLPAARQILPHLCGRDPADLDTTGIARAVIESVAENTSDAIVAPLLWGALAGPPGLAGYRAVNTLDAMVGHHCARYERFGWASARLDDVANWAPARLTALLAAACSPAVGGGPAVTWQTAVDDGPRHPSPNAGWCEAAFAGALGVRLGGTLSYAGRVEHRPALGTGPPPEPADIARAIRLSRAITAASTPLAAALAVAAAARTAPGSVPPSARRRIPPRPALRSSSEVCPGLLPKHRAIPAPWHSNRGQRLSPRPGQLPRPATVPSRADSLKATRGPPAHRPGAAASGREGAIG